MLNLLAAGAVGNTWSLPFENPFILWFQSLGGEDGFFHYFLYYLMNFISMFGEEMILVGIMGLLFWGIDKKIGERVGFTMISASVVNPLIKNVVCRTRPFDTEGTGIQNFRDVSGYSFPSGHSSGSAATFGGVAVAYGKKRKWIITVAVVTPVLVALSRTYLGAHYPTDVICGLALGVALVFLINWLYSVVQNKYFIYGGMAIIGAAGFFYCTTDDFFTAYGLLIGFICGILFEEKIIKFENTKVWWRIILRVLVGGGLYLGINAALKGVVGAIYKAATGGGNYKDNFWFESIFRVLRYAVVSFLMIGVYPLLFKQTEKLWKKFGWLKEKSADDRQNAQSEVAATQEQNVLGIVGFALSFVVGFVGLVLSAIGYKRAVKNNYDKKKMSLAGIIVSCVWIAIFAICMLSVISITTGKVLI